MKKENKPSKASITKKQGQIPNKTSRTTSEKMISSPGKEKKKREDFEDFEDFIDYKDFAKATGWKTSHDKKENNRYPAKAQQQEAAKNEKRPSLPAGKEKRNTKHRNSDYRATEIRAMGNRAADNKATDNKATDNKATGNRATDYRATDYRATGKRATDNRATNKRTTDKRTSNRGIEDRRIEDKKTIDKTIANRRTIDKKQSQRSAVQKGACPYLRECGGCNILSRSYETELASKQKLVEGLLKKYCKVEPILRMEQPDHYRHKVHVVFDHDRKGNPISGVYEEGTHRVIPVEQCLLHNEKADAIIKTIRGMLKSFKILTYDEDTGYGLLRHVLIRTGYHSKEIMVVLVLGSPILPSKNNFVKALRKEHPEITTVIVNVNDKKTSMVLGEKEQVIYGKGYIEDSLCGKIFRISPKSFYQVNPVQTEKLYQKAILLAGLSGNETVIDAYSGIGTIGLVASDHAKRVIGVELNKDAVKDAIVNAKRNQAENIEFYNNDAGVFLSQMAEQGESVDVIFMDPPRTGSTTRFLDAVAAIKPKKVVYISCNPVTLERDLEYLTKKGYRAETAFPVDMFPWTTHVETVVLMSKTGGCGSVGNTRFKEVII